MNTSPHPNPTPNPLASFTPEQKEEVLRAIAQVWLHEPSWITEAFVQAYALRPKGVTIQ